MTVLSEVFYVCLVTTSAGLLIKLASLCFQSKCKECVMCGGRIRIVRDTESEERQREFELTHPSPPSPSSTANAVSLGTSAL
jgi:hypothetical protein